MTQPQNLLLGTIEITNELDANGGHAIYVSFPEFDEISFVEQLGMLEVARDTLLRISVGEAGVNDG